MTALVAVATVALTVAAPGHAEDATSRARDSYARGVALADAGKWREAAEAFADADAIAPNDTALEAAIEAAVRAGDGPLALNLCERSERSAESARLPSVEEARRRFSSVASLLEIPCRSDPTPCAATVDGVAVERTRWWVEPGSREVRLEAGPTRLPARTVVALAGQKHVVLADEPTPASAASEIPAPTIESQGVSPWWLLVPGGVTVAAATVFAIQGVRTSSIESDLTALQTSGRPPAGAPSSERDGWVSSQQALVDDGESAATMTNVFLGVGAVAALTTVAMAVFVVDWGGEPEAREVGFLAAPLPGGGAAFVVEGRFPGL